MSVLKYLDLSTAHLPEAERTALQAGDLLDNDWPRVITHEYGWWVNVPSDPDAYEFSDQAPALARMIDHAHAQDCEWVNIDRDARARRSPSPIVLTPEPPRARTARSARRA